MLISIIVLRISPKSAGGNKDICLQIANGFDSDTKGHLCSLYTNSIAKWLLVKNLIFHKKTSWENLKIMNFKESSDYIIS